MCGIVGIVHSDPARPVPPAMIRRMCEAIRHRGPDDEGAYVDRNVGLGMRRLSIIDLAGGRQPIFNEDRSKVIDRSSLKIGCRPPARSMMLSRRIPRPTLRST